MYCGYSNHFGPNKFGDQDVLECCLRYIGDAMDACLIYKEGAITI
jgi:hypothetical protein